MPACRLIVCEKSSHWAPPLRDAVGQEPTIVETRSLAGCEAELAIAPTSIVAIEVTATNLEAVLLCLARVQERYPRAAAVCLLMTDAQDAAALVREAGAIDAISSVLDLPRVARLAQRQLAATPKQETSFQDFVAEQMPWPAQATTQN
jgi:hypothetical protein